LHKAKDLRSLVEMRRSMLLATLLLATPALAADDGLSTIPAKGTLVVEATGMNSDKGQLMVLVFDSDDTWMGGRKKTFKIAFGPIKGGRSVVRMENMPPGTYGVMAIHDENGDEDLETTWYGKPEEGVGASRNAHHHNTPPKFHKSKITLGKDAGVMTSIKMAYL